jgi:hypothetical protein
MLLVVLLVLVRRRKRRGGERGVELLGGVRAVLRVGGSLLDPGGVSREGAGLCRKAAL